MEVICLGELLIDMFPSEIGLPIAEVPAFRPKPGGAPANVAVGLARLGLQSAFIGKVGNDAFGQHLAKVLAKEGVETQGIRFDDYARTTLAFIANPNPHTSEFVFYRNPGADTRLKVDELDYELLQQAKALHFGSLSLVEEPIRSAVVAAVDTVRDAGGMISLDVNYRPTLWEKPEHAVERTMALLPKVNVLKVSDEELTLLTGEEDPAEGGRKLLLEGPDLCVVTFGAKGSYFRLAHEGGSVPGFEVRTVDATGCGDAFVAGLLARLVSGAGWRTQLQSQKMGANLTYANAVGALTATKQGAIPALPAAEEVDRFLVQQDSSEIK